MGERSPSLDRLIEDLEMNAMQINTISRLKAQIEKAKLVHPEWDFELSIEEHVARHYSVSLFVKTDKWYDANRGMSFIMGSRGGVKYAHVSVFYSNDPQYFEGKKAKKIIEDQADIYIFDTYGEVA